MKDGGPAFPRTGNDWCDGFNSRAYTDGHAGMSLRDWFAGMALQGFMAAQNLHNEYPFNQGDAKQMFEIADFMLAEREKAKA